jgi:hypothetical protein
MNDIFKVPDLSPTKGDITFYRRVGEKGEVARALTIGFYSKYARSMLLRYAKYWAMDYEDVSVMPDPTRRQRQENPDDGRG